VRRYTKALTVERLTLVDDGLSSVQTWTADGSTQSVFLPASKSMLERAGLLGVRATHVLLVPRGLTVTPDTTRFVDGATTYLARSVEDGPSKSTVFVERT
jgi:hypothetical protein